MEENTEHLETTEEALEPISHTDLMVGVFSEPRKTFDEIAKRPLRTSDWLIPLTVLLIISVVTSIIIFTNPVIVSEVKDKQRDKVEKMTSDLVKEEKMTAEEKEKQMNATEDRLKGIGTVAGSIFTSIGILVFGSLIFFIICAVYFGISKFFFASEDGQYKGAMIASALSGYINVISIILVAIVSMLLDRSFSDLSMASILDIDKMTFTGFLLAKLDVFTIASFFVFGIGLSRTMYQPEKEKSYLIMVFGLWIGFTLIWFLLTKFVPIFGMFVP